MIHRTSSIRCFHSLFFILTSCCLLLPLRADDLIPPDSAMAKAKDAHLVLIDSLNSNDLGKDVYQMKDIQISEGDGGAKVGGTFLNVEAEGLTDGAKGTLVSPQNAPNETHMIGFWTKTDADGNVAKIGLEAVDSEGEILMALAPVTADGQWAWKEFSLDTDFKPSYTQATKNGKLDLPIKEIRIVWFTEKTGTTRLAVNGLIASATGEDKGPDLEARMSTTGAWPADKPISASTLVINRTAQPQKLNFHFRVLTDSNMTAPPPPDPLYGSDRALGKPSRSLVAGKVVEEGSLTDNDNSTGLRTEDKSGGAEVIQEIDLEKSGTVAALRYHLGDANWAYKLDVSASDDGTTYTPVEGLQGVDLYKKWVFWRTLSDFKPFQARYLRFRYHKDGETPQAFQMPSTMQVLGGVANETWEPPATGPVIDDATASVTVPPKSFTLVPYKTKNVPGPGCYVLSWIAQGTNFKTGGYVQGFVLPAPLAKPIANSHVGMNSDTDAYADKMQLLGVGWMRFENMKWRIFWDGPGAMHFPFDNILKGYRAHNLQILPPLWQFPKDISTAPATPDGEHYNSLYPPKNNSDYADFCFQVAARYGSKQHPPEELWTKDKLSGMNLVNIYEMWNEPDLFGEWCGTFPQYLEIFRPGAEAVKRADPDAKISNGGLANMALEFVDPLQSYHYPDGKRPVDFMDILNVHHYTGKVPPEIARIDTNAQRGPGVKPGLLFEEELFEVDAWRRTYLPGKEVWLTETGYDIGGPRAVSDLHQTAWLPRDLMVIFAGGVDRAHIFRETGDRDDQWTGCGVLTDNGGYRPAFFSVATMIREIDGFDAAMRISPIDSNVWQVLFKKNGEYILAAWTVDGKGKLGLDLGDGTVTDSFGHKQSIKIGADFEVGIFPNYFHSASAQEQFGKLFNQAKAAREARFAERTKQAAALAVGYCFGGKESRGGYDYGKWRLYEPVTAEDVFDAAKGYGFTAAQGLTDKDVDVRPALDKKAVQMPKGGVFSFTVPAGRYTLTAHVVPDDASTCSIEVGGDATGGPLSFEKMKSHLENDCVIDVKSGQPVTLTASSPALLSWIKVTPAPAPAP